MLEIAAAVTGGSQAAAPWRSSFIDESHRDRCCPHSKATLALLAAKTTDQSRPDQPQPRVPRLQASHNEVGRGDPNCVRILQRLRVGAPTQDWISAGGFVRGESNLSWLSHVWYRRNVSGAGYAEPFATSRPGGNARRPDPSPNSAAAFVGTFEQKTVYMTIELCLSINS
jgi:hypothetical protein